MAKIRETQPKTTSYGYIRILNKELGDIITRIHSTSIKSGNELEKYISDMAPNKISNLDDFIKKRDIIKEGIYFCSKKTFKISKYNIMHREPDFIIFQMNNGKLKGFVIELKDGDNFDTKKSEGEKTIETLTISLQKKMKIHIDFYICCFNQNDKKKIRNGLKGQFELSNIITGNELCEMLKIERCKIDEIREKDAKDNCQWLVKKFSTTKILGEEIRKKPKEFALNIGKNNTSLKFVFYLLFQTLSNIINNKSLNKRRVLKN